MTARPITVGPGPGLRAAGHVRRRAGLGAVRPRGVRRRALGHALGGRPRARPRRRRLPGDRRAPPREGLPRLVVGHHARREPVRGRPGVRRRASTRRPSSSAGTRSSRRRRPGPERGCAASSSTTRWPVCLGNEPVRVGGAVVGRVTSGGQGYAVERSIAYAYLPPDCGVGTRGEVGALRRVGRVRGGARAALRPGRRAAALVSGEVATVRRGAGRRRSPARPRRSSRRGSGSPTRPATRPTRSPARRSGATSRSRRSPTGRS